MNRQGSSLAAASIVLALASSACDRGGDWGERSFNREALYLTDDKASAVSFGATMGIGSFDATSPSPANLRFQQWSERMSDCSDAQYVCVRAGKFQIFLPRAKAVAGQTYRYRGFALHAAGCQGENCIFELSNEKSPADTPIMYLQTDRRGIKSLGFGETQQDPMVKSREFKRSSPDGLFAG